MSQTVLVFLILAQCLGQSLSSTTTPNTTNFPGGYSGARLAYFNWRTWLLNHPAVQQKVPPIPKTDYNYNVSSGINNDALKVYVTLTPSNILNVDEVKQTLEIAASLQFTWNDPALALDSALMDQFTGGNVSLLPHSVTIPAQSVWLPAMIITEGVSVLKVLEYASDVDVYSDGALKIELPMVLSFSCKFDMIDYPFDQHDCKTTFLVTDSTAGVYPEPTGVWDQLSTRFGVVGEWDLLNVQSKTLNAPSVGAPFAQFVTTLKRKTTFYSVIIILPLVLTSYLNVLVFLLPPDLGDKCSYLVTVTISLSVFTSFFNVDMPRSFDAMPRIFYLFVFVLAEGFVALILSLVVIRKYKLEKDAEEALVVSSRVDNNIAPSPGQNKRNKNSMLRKAKCKRKVSAVGSGNNNGWEREAELDADISVFGGRKSQMQREEEVDGNWDPENVEYLRRRECGIREIDSKKPAGGFRVSAKNLDAIFFLIVSTANTLGMAIMLVTMAQT